MESQTILSLNTLIRRLEAATSRLEVVAGATEPTPGASALDSSSSHNAAIPVSAATNESYIESAEILPAFVQGYDSILSTLVDEYVKASELIDPLLANQAQKVRTGFIEQRKFLVIASRAKKPEHTGSDVSVLQELLKPINDAILAVVEVKDSNRSSLYFTHLNTVAAGILVLSWVTFDDQPQKHAKECSDSAQYWGNRLLKQLSEKDPGQLNWVESFYRILRAMRDYTKEYFPQGLLWNPDGQPAQEVANKLKFVDGQMSQTSTGPAVHPLPPPPPPLPPPAMLLKNVPSKSFPLSNTTGFGGVFSEINMGEGIAKSLRKVEKLEMTHKNSSLRVSSKVADSGQTRGSTSSLSSETTKTSKKASKQLDGKKWTIEGFEKESQPVQINVELSQNILISRCSNTTIIIKGKANAVTVENTARVCLIVDSLVSAVDVIRSQNFALQVLGAIPTVLMDEIDSANIYLSQESLATKLFCSKSTGVNLNVLSGPDDYQEIALPFQICSYFNKERGVLENEIVAHSG